MMYAPTPNTRCVSVIRAPSPAKINLSLRVLGRRADGFHEIRSLVLGVALNDTLHFEHSDSPGVTLSCDHSDLSTSSENLIMHAAGALLRRSGNGCQGARIKLTKRIPIASGLGGGSSNAATTLTALNQLWRMGLSVDDLMVMAAELGSDVPLFFALPASVISGRGEVVRPAHLRWSGWVVLAFAGQSVSTRSVYSAWSGKVRCGDDEQRLRAIQEAQTADEVARLCANDLEPAIFCVAPEVRTFYDALRACGGPYARITGAGQTAFVLFDDPDEAAAFCLRLKSSHIGIGALVVKTLRAPPTFD